MSTSPTLRQSVTQAATDSIVNHLADRTLLPAGYFLEQPTVEPSGASYGETVTFLVLGNGVRNPVQLRVTVEVLP